MPQEDGEGMSTCFCEDRFAVSAGDAKRSGYDEIYNLNEALLSELCCTFLCDQSIQESPELRAFEEEWCFFEKEEIADGI